MTLCVVPIMKFNSDLCYTFEHTESSIYGPITGNVYFPANHKPANFKLSVVLVNSIGARVKVL